MYYIHMHTQAHSVMHNICDGHHQINYKAECQTEFTKNHYLYLSLICTEIPI